MVIIPGNRQLLKLEKKLQAELENTLNQEEIMWFQRSREGSIRTGERNTKFYHAATTARKYRKNVKPLRMRKVSGQIIDSNFQALFMSKTPNNSNSNTLNGFPTIKEEHLTMLQRDFTREEIKQVVFDMDPFKSPGNDGFHSGFYQKTWETVRGPVCL